MAERHPERARTLPLISAEVFRKEAESNGDDELPGEPNKRGKKKSKAAGETREKLADNAGVGHDTMAKVKFISETAPEEVKEKLVVARRASTPPCCRVKNSACIANHSLGSIGSLWRSDSDKPDKVLLALYSCTSPTQRRVCRGQEQRSRNTGGLSEGSRPLRTASVVCWAGTHSLDHSQNVVHHDRLCEIFVKSVFHPFLYVPPMA